MKKRIFTLIIATVLFITVIPVFTACQKKETLNVFNWGQYIADGEDDTLDIVKEFEKETGIKVNYSTFDSNESMYAKLKSGGASYDIIIPSDYMVGRLIEENMLQEIDYSKLKNYSNVDDSFKSMYYDPDNKYTVPYTWGTVGIIYNTKYIKDDITGWDSLWNEKYKDKILMFSNSRDALAIGQSLVGVDPNTTDNKELQKVADKLMEQRPLVQEYVMDQIFDKMINEVAWIAPYYAGDYLYMKDKNEDLAFCHPKEGFNRFVDCMCIPKNSKNTDAAHKFIDYILRSDIQFANIDYIGYSSPFKAEYIPKEYLNDIAYPSESVLKNSFEFHHLPAETLQTMDSLWTEVRTS